ncbi:hypothetical protein [Pseudonocardia sp.]|jgi:hypothetical protein|uniref:hypothetical protein n=1 Tax=Pseudonocardia sp. TaxID=60912 RepID=UPI0031FCCB66
MSSRSVMALVAALADAAVAGLDVGMIGVNDVALASAASPYTVATAVTTKGRP